MTLSDSFFDVEGAEKLELLGKVEFSDTFLAPQALKILKCFDILEKNGPIMHNMTKKVKNTLYRLFFQKLFSDTFFKSPDCSVTQTPLAPLNSIPDKYAMKNTLWGGGFHNREEGLSTRFS